MQICINFFSNSSKRNDADKSQWIYFNTSIFWRNIKGNFFLKIFALLFSTNYDFLFFTPFTFRICGAMLCFKHAVFDLILQIPKMGWQKIVFNLTNITAIFWALSSLCTVLFIFILLMHSFIYFFLKIICFIELILYKSFDFTNIIVSSLIMHSFIFRKLFCLKIKIWSRNEQNYSYQCIAIIITNALQ